MGAPAGSCEWCGGQQRWTVHRGDLYVMCVAGCLDLFQEDIPPPDSESVAQPTTPEDAEHSEGGGVVGDKAALPESDTRVPELPF